MIIPIRCFTCGNVLADKELAYHHLVQHHSTASTTGPTLTGGAAKPATTAANTNRTSDLPFMDDVDALLALPAEELKSVQGKVLDELGVTKMCCRRHVLTAVDVLDDI